MAQRLQYCCLLLGALFALCAPNSTRAQSRITLPTEKTVPVKVSRFAHVPIIDGRLDDDVWNQAVKLKDFYQTSPGDNIAPSQPTEVFLGYDSNALYVAFHCYDDPSKVRANIARRDDIFKDDYVGMLLDTFNDHRKAYELDFNPLGVQEDGIWQDPIFNEDFNPDFVMESKGALTADGYTVEIAVPFKSLRYEAGKNKLWGVHFYRRIKRINNEFDSWMPIDRAQSGWMSQAGHLAGLEGISTEHTLQLIPSVTVSETGKRSRTLTPAQVNSGLLDEGRFVNAPAKLDPGLTGKYSLNPNITLDFALNPDFAQVEADQLVVTANQRFPIFFPEKRPFFLEGTDIFSTLVTAVNTRSIIDPDVAVKLSGKRGRNSFGVLAASDNGPGNLSESDREFIGERPSFILGNNNPAATDIATVQTKQAQLAHIKDKNALIGIARLKRDILSGQSYLGFLGTSYNFAGTNSQLASLDGLISINRQITFSWQALGSTSVEDFFFADTGRTQHRRENGFGYAFDLTRNGRNWLVDSSGIGRTLFFRTAVGFQTRVNYNNETLFVQYTTEPRPTAKIISFQIYDKPSMLFDWQGRARLSNNEVQAQVNLRRQAQVGLGVDNGYERLFEEEFGAKRQAGVDCTVTNNCTFAGASDERSTYNSKVYAFASVTPNKKLRLFFIARTLQDSFDFDFGAGPRYPRVSPSALSAARASQAGLCNVASPPAVCNAPLDPGPGSIFSMNTNIDFQPATPLNFNLDFTKQRLRRNDTGLLAFDENIATFRTTYQFTRFIFVRGRIDFDSLQANAKGQFLFGWTPNPGTALYVGYNDDVNRHGFNPFTGQFEPGLQRNERTFFIKMSYLFRRSVGLRLSSLRHKEPQEVQ
ncbi:MAG TPA: DUF5916 domain-containing protein [Pyrinomonadaceae bacterium]|nr:DUF5916 domain-containing protein [Pyrinomonadaceae bacterium]